MAVNIRKERVARLFYEVAALTGVTKAIRRALEEPRDRLARNSAEIRHADRLRRLLERETWPAIPPRPAYAMAVVTGAPLLCVGDAVPLTDCVLA